jgi:hypothetical protein
MKTGIMFRRSTGVRLRVSFFFWFSSRQWQQQGITRSTIKLTDKLDELLVGKYLEGNGH